MCSADGFQPDLEAREESSEICGGRHLNVSSQRLQGPVARKCQTLENHSEEAGEDVVNLVLADLPDGGHAQAAVKVDVQLHPGERLQRLKSFFQVLSTDYPGSLRSLGSPKLGLRIVRHTPPCCWQCSPPATLYHCRFRLDLSQFARHGVTGTSGESFSFVRTLSAIQTY